MYLYNTISKKKEEFVPLDKNNIRMYVCGPTVYDRPHLGNARSIVIFDVLFRVLKTIYPKVTYVRNITDVDDKINKAAKDRKITIKELTKEIIEYFHEDMDALNTLQPTIESKATEHIDDMIAMIEKLIENGNAYVSEGHVLFSVNSDPNYGMLSRRSIDEMIAGSRIEIAPYKENPMDFVLWKPADKDDDPSSIFNSPWGKGRPGWHIECSAMSTKYLGTDYDIHGGGADLQFPHHENEIAQSTCANPGSKYAKYWVHNGFLTVNGEKMSKSLGNFTTVRELLDEGIQGEIIRYVLLSTHYRKPLDFTKKALSDAAKALNDLHKVILEHDENNNDKNSLEDIDQEFMEALEDDLNTPKAIAQLHYLRNELMHTLTKDPKQKSQDLKNCMKLLGIYDKELIYNIAKFDEKEATITEKEIKEQIQLRTKAKKDENWKEADKIRAELKEKGIVLEDKPDGTTAYYPANKWN